MTVVDVGVNTVACPDCFSPGTATVRLAGGMVVGYFLCGSNTADKHRTPSCYQVEIARVDGRRMNALDYLRERMGGLKPQQHKLSRELASVTNVLCGGKPLEGK